MKIAVIGAGIGGLTAHHELTKLGHNVEVYEATKRAGGRSRLLKRPGTGDWADVGSQYYVESYSNILRIIDEVGLSHLKRKVEGDIRIYTGDGPSEHFDFNPKKPWMPGGSIVENLQFLWYAAKLLVTNKSDKYAPSPRGSKIDNKLAIESTKSKFIQDNLIRMSTRTGLLNDLEDSQVQLLHLQHQLASYGTNGLVTLEGGTGSLHQALAERATVHYNSPVKILNEVNGRVTGFTLESGEVIEADHTVVAANAVHAAKLIPDDWALEKAYLSRIEQVPTIIVSLYLSEQLPEKFLTTFLPFDHDTDVSFCTDANVETKGTTDQRSGKTTMQAWIINPKAAKHMDKTDAELIQLVRQNLAPYMPHIDNLIESTAVTRHQHTVPQFHVGHNEETHDFLDSTDARDGVSFCGDYVSNGNMESSVWCVQRMVKQIGEAQRSAA